MLMIGLLLSASFGLAMMNHMDDQGHNQCPLETTGVTDCAQVESTVDFVTSHLNAVSGFFSALPVQGFAFSLALLFALASNIFIVFSNRERSKTELLSVKGRVHMSFVAPRTIAFSRWFALHENSPAFIAGRA